MIEKDNRYRSRKFWGLWIAIGLVILVRAGEAFAQLKWPAFTLGDLPWLILGAYASYAGFNMGTHWANRAEVKSKIKVKGERNDKR